MTWPDEVFGTYNVDPDHYIVEEIDDPQSAHSAHEKEADDAAGDLLFPDGPPRVPARISGPWVDQIAAELGVPRIIVIGHLQHLRRLDWRTTLAKNAPSVSDALESWE
ncbi:ImmA/IrrE family metallo-endopeptidase [Lentzea terrae]|uniref:ImmA/IrrE family metallo-endopeptidase n=1 Tax=Lentzea terrae TaxID=2200761 RepID=UPI000DD4A9B7|nr:hypothetical protein [Lentzea terrae]